MANYSALSDHDLAKLLRDGNESAFNEIYNRNWAGIFLVARNRLKNDSLAEEIVQNIFCSLWRKRTDFYLEKSFKAYFAVAVKYEVINQTAKRKREIDFANRFTYTDVDNSTLQTLSFNELKGILEDSICLLPERCQLVFRLKIEHGYSQKQIAKELNISEKTVEAHLSKARKDLLKVVDPAISTQVTLFFITLFF